MFTVFATADAPTQIRIKGVLLSLRPTQRLWAEIWSWTPDIYCNEWEEQRSSATKLIILHSCFILLVSKQTGFYKGKVAEIRHVVFHIVYIHQEIISWPPSFSICNCFTCLWRFQQLLTKKNIYL